MTATIVRPLLPVDQRLVLSGSWESFKLIQQGFQGLAGARLSYFAGAIEIIMPGFQHEQFGEIIAYLLTTFLLMRGIAFYPSGAVTQEKMGEVSVQADKSYCFGQSKPIPDLSIEVVVSSGGVDKLLRYGALGVPEVWFWEDGTLKLFHWRSTGYESINSSQLPGLEDLDMDLVKQCILQAETDFAGAVEVFRVNLHRKFGNSGAR
jgi:Uma2 family endonuclease